MDSEADGIKYVLHVNNAQENEVLCQLFRLYLFKLYFIGITSFLYASDVPPTAVLPASEVPGARFGGKKRPRDAPVGDGSVGGTGFLG